MHSGHTLSGCHICYLIHTTAYWGHSLSSHLPRCRDGSGARHHSFWKFLLQCSEAYSRTASGIRIVLASDRQQPGRLSATARAVVSCQPTRKAAPRHPRFGGVFTKTLDDGIKQCSLASAKQNNLLGPVSTAAKPGSKVCRGSSVLSP